MPQKASPRHTTPPPKTPASRTGEGRLPALLRACLAADRLSKPQLGQIIEYTGNGTLHFGHTLMGDCTVLAAPSSTPRSGAPPASSGSLPLNSGSLPVASGSRP